MARVMIQHPEKARKVISASICGADLWPVKLYSCCSKTDFVGRKSKCATCDAIVCNVGTPVSMVQPRSEIQAASMVSTVALSPLYSFDIWSLVIDVEQSASINDLNLVLGDVHFWTFHK